LSILRRGTSSKFVSASVIASLSLCVLILAVPTVRADNSPLSVYGWVYDSGGLPVEGAAVLVLIVETSHTRYATTDADGLYSTSSDFNSTDYAVGNTIRVYATYNSEVVQNQTTVTLEMSTGGIAQVDVHFTYEIPEFGSLTGTVVAMSGVALVGAAFFARRRK
jgi:hypothetical protein